jgi:peptide/nickel transport system ATP-binding protein
LEVVDLVTHFRTPKGVARAVDGVSFTLEKGKSLGILGESGSGKSVLSRSILDILAKDGSVHITGQVLFKGRDLRKISARAMRDVLCLEIAMVFQDPMSSLNPVMKIGRQITEILEIRLGMSRTDARKRAIELLDLVAIPDAARQLDRYPMHLSGGMRQRVAIAVALAGEPDVLIADEPTTALDVTTQAQILAMLRQCQIDRDMAMILITHDLGVVHEYTDNVSVMYAGKMVENCPTPLLIADPRMPYSQALIGSAPNMANPPHTRLDAIPGLPPNLLAVPPGCRFAPRCKFAQPHCKVEMPPLTYETTPQPRCYACWHPLGDTAVQPLAEQAGA